MIPTPTAILTSAALCLCAACAEGMESDYPPPFARTGLDVQNLHIDYEPSLKIEGAHTLSDNELLMPVKIGKTCVPGRIPTFAFVATISAIGTYTLYGAGAGIVAAGIIYIATDGSRRHTRQAIWGCVAGMAAGGLVKWISVR